MYNILSIYNSIYIHTVYIISKLYRGWGGGV